MDQSLVPHIRTHPQEKESDLDYLAIFSSEKKKGKPYCGQFEDDKIWVPMHQMNHFFYNSGETWKNGKQTIVQSIIMLAEI